MIISKKKLFASLLMSLLLSACSPSNEAIPEETPSEAEEISVIEEEEIKDQPGLNISVNLEEEIYNPESIFVLVNKEYSIGEYIPDDLVTVEVSTVLENSEVWQMRTEAADALKELFEAAAEEGVTLYSRSGYRSYLTQVQLYENYVASHGEVEANKFSSRPGHSEHQTGLAMDITSESVGFQLTEDFGETEEGKWLANNAHHFGFIIRYPEGKTDVTGYIYEPWHIRYLGKELSSAIFESDLTYEEFLLEHEVIKSTE